MIHVKNLSKHFKVPVSKTGRFAAIRNIFSAQRHTKIAVDAISFNINKGEIVGYVGPNGAGKSTSIKMLSGILVPTSGHVEIAGLVPYKHRKEHVRHIGVVFGQKTQLWWDVPVAESLRILKEIYQISAQTYQSNLALFRELFGLNEFEHTPVRQLSLGQRMRADLIAALLHSPDILFLDEPTIGIDVMAKDRFRDLIRQLNRELAITILLTTHDMAEIERLCSRVIMIDQGKILHDGPMNEIQDRFGSNRTLEVEFEKDLSDIKINCQVELLSLENRKARIQFNRHHISASDLIIEIASQYPVKDISVKDADMESIVKDLYSTKSDY